MFISITTVCQLCNRSRIARFAWLLILPLLATSGALAQETPRPVKAVRTIYPSEWDVARPVGLTYSKKFNQLLLLDERDSGRGIAESATVVTITPFEDLVGADVVRFGLTDAINIAIDDVRQRLFLLNQQQAMVEEIAIKSNGRSDPGNRLRSDIARLGIQNARGMSVDAAGEHLFILDNSGSNVVRIELGGGAGLDDAQFAKIDLATTRGNNLRGIAVHPATNHMHILSPNKRLLFELTQEGSLVATYDLASLDLSNPNGISFAPSTDLTDDPATIHLFIADRGPSNNRLNGKIVETSLDQSGQTVRAAALLTVLNLVQTVHTSAYSPPSPDTAGIGYLSTASNPFMMSDSEVNEMPIFTGVNLFQSSLSGVLARTGTTTAYSGEPTGVSFDPAGDRMFISDDNADKIFEVLRGSDNLFGTDDDIVSNINTRAFNSFDPEGVAFDTTTGDLLIIDGVNREVYRLSPGTNGVFDGLPPGGDDAVTSFDTLGFGLNDPEGGHHDAVTGHIFLIGPGDNEIYETTSTGVLVQALDFTAANPVNPAGIVLAPGSSNPSTASCYVVDRGIDNGADPNENDGKLYELAPCGAAAPTPTVTATPMGAPTATVTPTPTNTLPPADTATPTATSTATPTSTPLPQCAGPLQSISVRVSASSDDAEENASGVVDLTSSDLELVQTGSAQIVGIRFRNVGIPAGHIVVSATIEFETDETGSVATSLTFHGEAADSALPFTSTAGDVSGRPQTAASVDWPNVPAWTTVNQKHTTPNLAAIVQEIISRSGWASGNAVAFIVTGSGTRTAESFDGESAAAPLLSIDHCSATPPTSTPTSTATATPTPTITPGGPTFTPTSTATPTNTPTATPTPGSNSVLYLSASTGGTVGGISFGDEDVLTYDTITGAWAMFYDGKDVSDGTDLDMFALQDDGSLLLSFIAPVTIPNLGTVDDSDIVRFIPTSTGLNTAGSFEWYLDGSDVELEASGEDIYGGTVLSDGRVIVSLSGSYSVTGASGGDEDLIALTPTQLGETTSGSWALYFDGSDVGLNNSGNEDVWGTWIDEATGDIYLTTKDTFAVTGLSGDGADIFVCTPSSLGDTTACTFSLFWDGSAHGFAGLSIDALAIADAQVSASIISDEILADESVDDDEEYDDSEDDTEIELSPVLFLPSIQR